MVLLFKPNGPNVCNRNVLKTEPFFCSVSQTECLDFGHSLYQNIVDKVTTVTKVTKVSHLQLKKKEKKTVLTVFFLI